jgi:hypothetical protein
MPAVTPVPPRRRLYDLGYFGNFKSFWKRPLVPPLVNRYCSVCLYLVSQYIPYSGNFVWPFINPNLIQELEAKNN